MSTRIDILRNKALRACFEIKFSDLNLTQHKSLQAFQNSNHVLITSPTGSGKTLAAFLGIVDSILVDNLQGLTAVYLCPLKSLTNDLVKNLESFLNDVEGSDIKVRHRTGDSKSSERSKSLQTANIYCTTPESLSIVLTSEQNCRLLSDIRFLVVDEAHAFAGTKRGTEVAILVARLKLFNPKLQIVALSATVDPIDRVAEWLFGSEPYTLVHEDERLKPTLSCIVPKQNSYEDLEYSQYLMELGVLSIVRKEMCTLIFVNTRSAAESLAYKLSLSLGEQHVAVHHSSMSRNHRWNVEQRLKESDIKVVVSSCALEQGIDMPGITKVIQCYSPKQVNKATQRLGRAGHAFRSTSSGIFFALTRCEAVEIAVILECIMKRRLDKVIVPTNCLDMLVQAVINLCLTKSCSRSEITDFVRSISVYRNISEYSIECILNYLLASDREEHKRRYFARLYLKDGMYFSYKGLKRLEYMLNLGSIVTDELLVVKHRVTKEELGRLDATFLEDISRNETFILGGRKLTYIRKQGNTVWALPTQGELNKTPSWYSENLPISFEVGCEVTNFRSKMLTMMHDCSKDMAISFLRTLYVDSTTLTEIYDHFKQQFLWLAQRQFTDMKNRTLIELTSNQEGIITCVIHLCFGQRLNALISILLRSFISERLSKKTSMSIKANNNGIVIHFKEVDLEVLKIVLPDSLDSLYSNKLENQLLILQTSLPQTEFFDRYLKKNAFRSLAMLGKQVEKSVVTIPNYVLLNSMKKPHNIVYMETLRELTFDYLNFDTLTDVILKQGLIGKSLLVVSDVSSPFSHGVIFSASNVDMKLSSEFITNVNHNIIQRIKDEVFDFFESDLIKIQFFKNVVILTDKETCEQTLVLGDTHIGMEYVHKIQDASVLFDQIANISYIFKCGLFNLSRIIILGDVKESVVRSSANEQKDLADFFTFLRQYFKQVVVIKGNHDGKIEDSLNVKFYSECTEAELVDGVLVARKLILRNCVFIHGDQSKADFQKHSGSWLFCGHEHPKFSISENGFSKSLTGILQVNMCLILPSFNPFKTGRLAQNIINQEKYRQTMNQYFGYVFDDNLWHKIKLDSKLELPE